MPAIWWLEWEKRDREKAGDVAGALEIESEIAEKVGNDLEETCDQLCLLHDEYIGYDSLINQMADDLELGADRIESETDYSAKGKDIMRDLRDSARLARDDMANSAKRIESAGIDI